MATKLEGFRFAFDIDNTTANSADVAKNRLNETMKLSQPLVLKLEDFKDRPFYLSPRFQALGITNADVSKVLDTIWRIHYREIKLMDERIPEVLAHLREEGCTLEIITAQGARDHSIRPNMVEWLERNKVPYDKLNFVASSEEKLAYPVHTIVDDEQQVAVGLAKLTPPKPGLLYHAYWNAEFRAELARNPNPLIIPVANWAETQERVFELMERLRTD